MNKEPAANNSMSSKKAFIIAALLGLTAFVLFLSQGAKQKRKMIEELGEIQKVVVAKSEILPGTEITTKQVEIKELHAKALQPRVATSLIQVESRVAQIPILPGQQILESMLYEEGGGYLSLRVGKDPRRRAVTLKMDGEGMLAGLIRPGDVVDIMGVFEAAAGGGGMDAQARNHAMILVQQVKILAVDASMSEFSGRSAADSGGLLSDGSSGSQAVKQSALVTFDVDAEEAWQLGMASQIAHLRCLLRSRSNNEPHEYEIPQPGRLPRIESDKVFQAGGVTIQNMKPFEMEYR